MSRMLRLILILALVSVGCSSYLDFERPLVRNYAAERVAPPSRPAEPLRAATERTHELAAALARWRHAAPEAEDDYAVGPGDAIRVALHVPADPHVEVSVETTLGPDGTGVLPLLGKVALGGLTTAEIEQKLTRLYAEGYYNEPVLNVIVTRHASKRVLVTGAVASPRVVTMEANRIALLEALLHAGGLAKEAGETARLTRAAPPEGEAPDAVEIELDRLASDAALQQQVWLYPGDVVYVPPAEPPQQQYFYVLGYVRAPGAYALPADGSAVGVVEAIAFAHGLAPAGRAEKTYLLRKSPDGLERYRLDLSRIAAAEEPDVVIQPGDKIIVGTSWGRRTLDGLLHVVGLRSLAPASF